MIYQFTFMIQAEQATRGAVDKLGVLAECIYSSCRDATVGMRCGRFFAGFDREADSLEDAVASALRDCHKVPGVYVIAIEYETPAVPVDLERVLNPRLQETTSANQVRSFLIHEGYRACDIPACNCGGYHGGNASNRLDEIKKALDYYGQGKTILQMVEEAVADQRRYQFLKKNCAKLKHQGHYMNSPLFGHRDQTLDEALDKEIDRG